MVSDFAEANAADAPSFFYHLQGVDAITSGRNPEYYDAGFTESYRRLNSRLAILGIAGNHDGIVYPSDPAAAATSGVPALFATPASSSASPDAGGLA